jgi:DNA-binding NarL/FixJ family response regulator
MSIKVGIVDDKLINRKSIKDRIFGYKEVTLMLEAVDGQDFLGQLKLAVEFPDVVLMDLEMPELNGIQTISIAASLYPHIRFIVLTIFEDDQKIFDAIKAGASGYLLKEDSAVNLIDAIINVKEFNGIPMSPGVARKAMEMLRQMPIHKFEEEEIDKSISIDNFGLSDRELEVLKALESGKSYKAIGERLFISPYTVRKHVSNIYQKLHVSGKVQLIQLSQKQKLI